MKCTLDGKGFANYVSFSRQVCRLNTYIGIITLFISRIEEMALDLGSSDGANGMR